MMNVRDLMTEKPATVGPTWTVRSAAQLLQALDVRHLPVVNEDQELVGMISDRDLRSLHIPYFVGPEHVADLRTALDATVATLMNADVVSVDEEADAAEAVDLMLDNKIGAVPVTNADGKLVGIVSYVDVLRIASLDI